MEQGAEWPDSLSNEQDPEPLNPQAVALVDALQRGDRQGFLKTVEREPALLNARGPEGSTPFMYAVAYGDIPFLTRLLDLGADPNRANDARATALMWGARDFQKTRLLVSRGADVNATNRHTKAGDAGLTVLDLARLNGNAAVVRLLEKHGARGYAAAPVSSGPKPRPVNTARKAVEDSLPLLQKVDASFTRNAGCTSCHNNSMQAMAAGQARHKGLALDETIASAQTRFTIDELAAVRDRLHQGFHIATVGDMFTDFTLGYELLGLHAQNHPADLNTDAVVQLIRSRQRPTGEWRYPRGDQRPPLCLDYITQTSLAMRAIQLYPPKLDEAGCGEAVRRAASWLAKAKAVNNDDRAWRLTGLAWAGNQPKAMRHAYGELLAQQKADGGWADRANLPSSAYATGLSLVALHTAGMSTDDPVYQRGVQFLLRTQQEDGSWYVRTRALGFQPFFDSGFPHGHDQWMSAAGTSWATMALTRALPDSRPLAAAGR